MNIGKFLEAQKKLDEQKEELTRQIKALVPKPFKMDRITFTLDTDKGVGTIKERSKEKSPYYNHGDYPTTRQFTMSIENWAKLFEYIGNLGEEEATPDNER